MLNEFQFYMIHCSEYSLQIANDACRGMEYEETNCKVNLHFRS